MINFEIHTRLLDLDDLNLASNLSSLTLPDQEKLAAVNVLQVKEKAHFQRDLLDTIKSFLGFSIREHHVHLILIEPYPSAKSRIRTKKGLFHKHKGQFDPNTVFETEIDISTDQSLFAGAIWVTEESMDDVVDHFDDLPIAFGLLSPQEQSPFHRNSQDFLEEIVLKGLKPGNIYWKNWLQLAALLVKPGSKFFSLQDLNDTEHFRVFYHQEDVIWEDQLKNFISQELQIDPMTEK